MKQDDLQQALIDGTIHIIAQKGLDKATTKAISNATGINEVYIYRLFDNKEKLFEKAFEHLDKQLVDKCLLHVEVMYTRDMDYETKCRIYFLAIWRFLIGNKDEILMYIRYYYSSYFKKSSLTFLSTKPKSCGIASLKIILPTEVLILPETSSPSTTTVRRTIISS